MRRCSGADAMSADASGCFLCPHLIPAPLRGCSGDHGCFLCALVTLLVTHGVSLGNLVYSDSCGSPWMQLCTGYPWPSSTALSAHSFLAGLHFVAPSSANSFLSQLLTLGARYDSRALSNIPVASIGVSPPLVSVGSSTVGVHINQ